MRNRVLTWDLIKRDLKIRYQGSIMGRYWNLIHPLAMIVIYTIVFSKVMGAKGVGKAADNPFGYTLYLCAGLIPWMAFSDMVTRTTDVFIEGAHLIKKISFPLEVLPFVIMGSSSITFMISMGIYFCLLLLSGYGLAYSAVMVPVAFILLMLFALGLGMILSVFNVFFRDTKQVVSIVFQVWFWLTPIIYLASNAPEAWRWVFLLNPVYYFIELFHVTLVDQRWPEMSFILTCFGIATITYLVGSSLLGRFKSEIPDEI